MDLHTKRKIPQLDSGFENHNNGKGGLIEFGAGYFMKLDDNFVFETYAGFGGGKISFDDQYRRNNSIQNRTYNADMSKLFLQPSIGYTSDNFDASFSLRFVTVKYNNQRSSNYSEDDLRTDLLFDLHKTQWTFIETTMTLRGGFKYVKLYLQLGRSFKLNPEPMQNSQAILGLGLTFCYAPRFMK
ncbi:MAG: hypothetical protein H7321_02220 [Bacteroidia bacterium]|nr:hypothetical protein [Bacteroidia bacterium]